MGGLTNLCQIFCRSCKVSLNIPGVNFVVATKFNQDLLEKFFGKLRQKSGAYGAFTCKEFSQSYSIVFSVNHMQLRLHSALSEGEMPWKILMLIYHCQRIKEDSGKSSCLLSCL